MSNLHTLFEKFKVSPWLDNLSRELIESGKLQDYVNQGVRGITSNPTIFQQAFSSGVYDSQLRSLATQSISGESAYWKLAIEDIQQACDILRPVFDSSEGNDGFVSLEVDPRRADNSKATVSQAADLWEKVNRPNLMIKIPATVEGLSAITETISAGINVNVTLIFSLHRYLQVINAYMSGLEKLSNPSSVRSVASFFVSRVDGEVDNQLKDARLQGLAAVAQARAAYGIFLESFSPYGERWVALLQKHAASQRPLWASTSTKNPLYPELKYVEGLLTPNSVNTLPSGTIKSILEKADFNHSQLVEPQHIEEAHEQLAMLASSGIDIHSVSKKLEADGVKKFQESFTDMIESIS